MGLNIYNIKEKPEYLKQVITLEHEEWAKEKDINKENRIKNKIEKVKKNLSKNDFCKLVLLDEDVLIGFISLFPHDSDKYKELTPWYATMYVKKEYRGKGYSRLLNNAIIAEAKKRGFKKLYLKTTLNNYYEKFGAKYIKNIDENEKLYEIDI